ncbi:hypothetical protein NP493_1971g00014 [Ridgeia piscesae]|uniref:Alpha-L-fucosidase C-terminal domain-containing protein n=1 Tax=Ridgeia piscesae TaxID=27915 RepID=A0AAD9JPY8_RIDPI|nr:hypothetical protein NP493_1971g00014 [Ridgeia piscesae]
MPSTPRNHGNTRMTVTPNVWYTSKKTEKCENYASTTLCIGGTAVYAIVLDWPKTGLLELGAVSHAHTTTVRMLGYSGGPFTWSKMPGGGMVVEFPNIPTNQMPCQWAWVLQFDNLP